MMFKYLNKLKVIITFTCFILVIQACNNNNSNTKNENKETEKVPTGTPVTITKISIEPITEFVELNATSVFLNKSYVKSNLTGYIQSVYIKQGESIKQGQNLFTLITKEAKSIDNKINELNKDFKFSGVNTIKATGNGFITQLNHQVGDYVQDGEQLAVISNLNSFVFLLNLPYELKRYVNIGKAVDLLLSDGSKLNGIVSSALPTVDPATQTQNMVIKVTNNNIPENLIAKVKILKTHKEHSLSLPKRAVLSNDTQTEYWVMKVIDSNTAAKIPITIGIETKDLVEILSPSFDTTDKIILTGNYGLPDTAKIIIIK